MITQEEIDQWVANENMNSFDGYQTAALGTAIYKQQHKILYPALGLAGEAGEVADKVKKILRDGNYDNEAIAKELSDVLWYAAVLAHDLGYQLSEIAEMNLKKLQSRKERGVLGGSGDDR